MSITILSIIFLIQTLFSVLLIIENQLLRHRNRILINELRQYLRVDISKLKVKNGQVMPKRKPNEKNKTKSN